MLLNPVIKILDTKNSNIIFKYNFKLINYLWIKPNVQRYKSDILQNKNI